MINFETVRWKNILSTGNTFTEIQLNRSNNTLIVGHNGAGKSTILDALCFGLFGKPFRKVNKPNLLNSINNKNGVVEIEFSIGSKAYKVVRSIKPNTFEIYCDGKMLNQDAAAKDYQELLEKQILKMNFKTFTQVVILGSASFVPFMQLSAPDRRAIIEDLLDIEIFSTMNSVLKEKLSVNKDALTEAKNGISLTQDKIELQLENIQDKKNNNDVEIQEKKDLIVAHKKELGLRNDQIEVLKEEVAQIDAKINGRQGALSVKVRELEKIESKIDGNIQNLSEQIQFLHDNDDCPTCKQAIDPEFKEKRIEEQEIKRSQQVLGLSKISSEIKLVQTDLNEVMELSREAVKRTNDITSIRSIQFSIADMIKRLEKEIEALSVKVENNVVDNDKLANLRKVLVETQARYEELLREKQYMDFATTLLKDTGIKTRIIKQYLPIINKLINKYLKAMDFFVNFNIDENFEETIKSRHRDEFSYANFSEGEKMRIDLALLFTWRQIAKMKNSVSTNLLILDEVFDSSLDSGGTDEFLKLIHEMGNDTNIFVISHKGDVLFDKFRSIIKFQKVKNFSQVVK